MKFVGNFPAQVTAYVASQVEPILDRSTDEILAGLQGWVDEYKKKPTFSKRVFKKGLDTKILVRDPVRAGKRSRVHVLAHGADGPWIIRPKVAAKLAWRDGDSGEYITANQVLHPGIMPHPIPNQVVNEVVQKLCDTFS